MNLEQYISSGILEQYALGLLTDTEMQEVDAMVLQHPEVGRELELLQQTLTNYAAEHTITPPAGLRERVIAAASGAPLPPRTVEDPTAARPTAPTRPAATRAAARTPGTPKTGAGSIAGWVAAGIMTLLAGVFAFLWFSTGGDREVLAGQLETTQSELATLRTSCEEDRTALQQTQTELNFWQNARSVPLTYIRTRNKAPLAIIYWNDELNRGQIRATNALRDLAPGQVYQLWADVDGALISLGTFTDQEGSLQNLQYVEGVDAFNVTVEPEGGSEAPTLRTLFANAQV